MKFISLIIFVMLSFSVLAQDNTKNNAEQLQIYQQKLIQNLKSENIAVRKMAVSQLALLGDKIIQDVMAIYPSADFYTRRDIISLMYKIDTPKSHVYLFKGLLDIDKGVRNRASCAILHLSENITDLKQNLENCKTKSKDYETSRGIGNLNFAILTKNVEKELLSLIQEGGGTGFFDGQFSKMRLLGPEITEILLTMFSDEDYLYITKVVHQDEMTKIYMRSLAGQSFGELVDIMDDIQKQNVISVLEVLASGTHKTEDINKISIASLYKMGAKASWKNFTDGLHAKIQKSRIDLRTLGALGPFAEQKRDELARQYNELAMMYLRVSRDQEAIGFLKKALEYRAEPIMYYNLACSYSTLGQIEKALDTLEKAIKEGYDDVNWILADGDLKKLHKEPRFKKMIADLKKKLAMD